MKPETLKSIHNHFPVKAEFKNDTQRTVHLYWYDLDGKQWNISTEHGIEVLPEKTVSLVTSVSHIWQAKDKLGAPLLINGKEKFVFTIPASVRSPGVGELGCEILEDATSKQEMQALLGELPPVELVITLPGSLQDIYMLPFAPGAGSLLLWLQLTSGLSLV